MSFPVAGGPLDGAARLAGQRGRVLLHSARDDDGLGRWSFAAANPTAISGTYLPTFKNTFSAIQIRGSSPQVGGADTLDEPVPFVAKDDGSNPPWKSEYTSTDSTAW